MVRPTGLGAWWCGSFPSGAEPLHPHSGGATPTLTGCGEGPVRGALRAWLGAWNPGLREGQDCAAAPVELPCASLPDSCSPACLPWAAYLSYTLVIPALLRQLSRRPGTEP